MVESKLVSVVSFGISPRICMMSDVTHNVNHGYSTLPRSSEFDVRILIHWYCGMFVAGNDTIHFLQPSYTLIHMIQFEFIALPVVLSSSLQET